MSPTEHLLEYHVGLAISGIADDVPHWRCSCGAWRINRNLITGSPARRTALRHHTDHVRTVSDGNT